MLEICVGKQSVRYRGREAKLPEFSFRLLRLLGERAPAPVPFEEIERAVWAAQVTRETIKQRVKMLRDSLAALGVPDDAIESARNVGYRLTLSLGHYEPRTLAAKASRWKRVAWAIIIVLLVGAGALALRLPGPETDRAAAPLSLSVRSEPLGPGSSFTPSAWDGARRTLVRDLSKMRNLVVISASGERPRSDLVVEMALVPSENGERLALQLVQARTGAVLWAETYAADAGDYERALTHFAGNIHAQVEVLGLKLGRDGFPHQPRDVQELYLSAAALARGGDEADLLAARARLNAALAQRPAFALARSLKARIDASLVIDHGRGQRLALDALAEARSLVGEHPEVPVFRHTLAVAQIATGNLSEALRNLRIAERDLPFLRRDVLALERRIKIVGDRPPASLQTRPPDS